MKKSIISSLFVIAAITASFAGGTWTLPAIPAEVAVENTQEGVPVLLANIGGPIYVMPLAAGSSQLEMVHLAQAAIQNQRKIQIWYSSSSNKFSWHDLSGSAYSEIKIDGVKLN